MRLITFLLTTALVALVAASSSSSATDPVRFQRIVKRGVIKGLVVANPTEAKAWKKYRKHFKVQINYSTDVSKGAKVSGVSYAPMRRRGQSRSRFRKEAIASIKAGARYLLHYNERASLELAELTDELAITASRARKAPRIGRKKKYPHVKGVAGNIAASDTGLKYIKDFRKHCKSCRISRYAFHVYNKKNRAVSTGIKKLKAWVKQVEHVAGSTKLMVTEFGNRTRKASAQRSFLRKAVHFFRHRSSIKAIVAFPNISGGAFVKHGKLTSVGKAWANMKKK